LDVRRKLPIDADATDLFFVTRPSPPEKRFLAGSDSPEDVDVAGVFSYW
jgi:hypothetical protein